MTNDERDRLIMETHASVRSVARMAEDHHKTLYGNGDPGLKAKLQEVQQAQQTCPARLAITIERRGLSQSKLSNVLQAGALTVLLAEAAVRAVIHLFN